MDIESMKFLADYGIAILVLVGVIYWLGKILNHKVDANTKSIDTLTQAITAMTTSMSELYKTCERSFEDNRRTITTLIKHIETDKED